MDQSRDMQPVRATAQMLYDLGEARFDAQHYADAIPLYEQALSLAQAEGQREIACKSLNCLGLLAVELGQLQAAPEYYARALVLAQSAQDQAMIWKISHNLAQLARQQGHIERAIEYCQAAIDAASLLADDALLGQLHLLKGELSENSNDVAAAQEYQVALSRFRLLQQTESEAVLLARLGNIDWRHQRDAAAVHYYEQALPLFHALGQQPNELAILTSLATLEMGSNRYDAAWRYLLTALPLARELADRSRELFILQNLVAVARERDDNAACIRYAQDALTVATALPDPDSEYTLIAALAEATREAGQLSESLAYYQRQLPLARAQQNLASQISSLGYMGVISDELERYDDATRYYQESLALARSAGRRDYACTTLYNLGYSACCQGNYDEATEYLAQSLAIAQQLNEPELIARSQHAEAFFPTSRNVRVEYASYYRRALVRTQSQGKRSEERIWLEKLGLVAASLDDRKAAREYSELVRLLAHEQNEPDIEALACFTLAAADILAHHLEQAITNIGRMRTILQDRGARDVELRQLMAIGELLTQERYLEQAVMYYQQALPLARDLQMSAAERTLLKWLGYDEYMVGHAQQASMHYEAALKLARAAQDYADMADILSNLGEIDYDRGAYEQSSSYHESAVRLLEQLNSSKLNRASQLLARTRHARFLALHAPPSLAAPVSMQVIRVFVSSTFNDLQKERNALQERVFPRIQDLCHTVGVRFQAIDLRWGVSNEASYDQRTMAICLEEIAHCQRISPNFYFLALLSARYGSRLLPDVMPAADFESLLYQLGTSERQELTDWYQLDANALQPAYVLKKRLGTFTAHEQWSQTNARLQLLLSEAGARATISTETRAAIFTSATEREIQAGILQQTAPGDPLILIRDFAAPPTSPAAQQFVVSTTDERDRLAALKDRLQTSVPGDIRHYTAQWRDNEVSDDHLAAFCDLAYTELVRRVESSWGQTARRAHIATAVEQATVTTDAGKHISLADMILLATKARVASVDALRDLLQPPQTPGIVRDSENERILQDFATARTAFFHGRDADLAAIAAYLSSQDDPHPFVIAGPGGVGKTALVVKAAERAPQQLVAPTIIMRIIGVSPASSDLLSLLTGVTSEMMAALKTRGPLPTNQSEMIQLFVELLHVAPKHGSLLIIIDGVDQLHGAPPPEQWLPHDIAAGIRLLLTHTDDVRLAELRHRLPQDHVHLLGPLSPAAGEAIINDTLAAEGRVLQPAQHQAIAQHFAQNGLPLYLRLLLIEARRWRSTEPVPELATDIPGMFAQLFARLELPSYSGNILVSHALGLLAASRHGLTEHEMLDLLSRDATVMHAVATSSLYQPGERIPISLWLRLHAELEPYLLNHLIDNRLVLDVAHQALRQAIIDRYLAGATYQVRHADLANYFWAQDDHISLDIPNLRRLAELPYHLYASRMLPELRDLLTDLTFLYHLLRFQGTAATHNALALLADDPAIRDVIVSIRIGIQALDIAPEQLLNQIAGRVGPASALHHPYHLPQPTLRLQSTSLQGPLTGLIGVWKSHLSNEGVRKCCFSPDGMLLATAGGDSTVIIWEVAAGQPRYILRQHFLAVTAIAFSTDGRLLLSAAHDQCVCLWDVATGALTQFISLTDPPIGPADVHDGVIDYTRLNPAENIGAAALSPDGTTIAIATWDGHIRLWDIATQQLRQRWQTALSTTASSGQQMIAVCQYSPDGRFLVTTRDGVVIQLWNVAEGRLIRELHGHQSLISCCTFSPDSALLVSSSLAVSAEMLSRSPWEAPRQSESHQPAAVGEVRLWNVATGEQIRAFERPRDHVSVMSCTFTPDGRSLLECAEDLVVWDVANGSLLRTYSSLRQGFADSAVSLDGQMIATCSDIVQLWDLALPAPPINLLATSPWGTIARTAFSPDGQWFATKRGQTIALYATASNQQVWTLQGHSAEVELLRFSPDGTRLLSAGKDQTVREWDVVTGQAVRVFAGAPGWRWSKSFAFSPDATTLLFGAQPISLDKGEHTLFSWDFRSGHTLSATATFPYAPTVCDWSANGQTIIVGTYGWDLMGKASPSTQLWVWGRASNQVRTVMSDYYMRDCAVSADGRTAILGSIAGELYAVGYHGDPNAYLVDLATDRLVGPLVGHEEGITVCAFTPDGRYALTGSSDRLVCLWDVATRSSQSLCCLDAAVTGIAVHPDGRQVLVSDETGIVHRLALA